VGTCLTINSQPVVWSRSKIRLLLLRPGSW
jgi:hypothetical protein